jgi:hypothetical protein
MFYALITTVVPESIRGMKAAMVLGDFAILGLLIRLLKTTGYDPQRVVLYAWSPLVVFEFAGSGHVDALYLSGAISLSYLAYTRHCPVVPAGIHLLEFLPLYLLLLAQAMWQRWQSLCVQPSLVQRRP